MIKGFMKSSFSDYPEKICSTIFIGGCNFRCPYCHNADIVFNKTTELNFDQILKYLIGRREKIDAVCITGGEPTLWKGLIPLMKTLKKEGFLIKLDTNGTKPGVVSHLIDNKLVDYISMDIKAPLAKYEDVARTKVNIGEIKLSIDLIKESSIEYDFRTTVHSMFLSKKDIIQIAQELKGSRNYALQEFRYSEKLIDTGCIGTNSIDKKQLERIKSEIEKLGLIDKVIVR